MYRLWWNLGSLLSRSSRLLLRKKITERRNILFRYVYWSVHMRLLMIGYSPRDIIVYLCKKDFSKHFGKISMQNFLTNYGLVDTSELKKYLETIIIEKLGFIPTLKDMHDAVKKIFYCTGYRVSHDGKESQAKTYFSYETHPTMLLSDAIMCSCSIPFLFSRSLVKDGTYVNGAVFDPIPVKILMDYFRRRV